MTQTHARSYMCNDMPRSEACVDEAAIECGRLGVRSTNTSHLELSRMTALKGVHGMNKQCVWIVFVKRCICLLVVGPVVEDQR